MNHLLPDDERLRTWRADTPGTQHVTHLNSAREAAAIVIALRRQGIHTSATLQWYGLADLGPRSVKSAVRVSPHYFNTEDELTRAESP